MSRQHVVKFWARQLQKKTYTEKEIPEDMREEAIELAKTLPLRPDMIPGDDPANQTPVEE